MRHLRVTLALAAAIAACAAAGCGSSGSEDAKAAVTGYLNAFARGWHALSFCEGRGCHCKGPARPSHKLRACHPLLL